MTNQFTLDVSRGRIHNLSAYHKFGNNPDILAGIEEDVWSAGGVYTFPSDSGIAMQLVSSALGDTTQTVVVEGLDENFLLKEEEVSVNGTTAVSLSGLWSRIFRAYNTSSDVLVGTVSIQNTAGTVTYAEVRPEEQQTSMAIYTVPANMRAYLLSYYGAINRQTVGGSADLFVKMRSFGGVFLEKEHIGLQIAGKSMLQFTYEIPLKIEPKTDIKLSANVTNNNTDIAGGFDLILVKNPSS